MKTKHLILKIGLSVLLMAINISAFAQAETTDKNKSPYLIRRRYGHDDRENRLGKSDPKNGAVAATEIFSGGFQDAG